MFSNISFRDYFDFYHAIKFSLKFKLITFSHKVNIMLETREKILAFLMIKRGILNDKSVICRLCLNVIAGNICLN